MKKLHELRPEAVTVLAAPLSWRLSSERLARTYLLRIRARLHEVAEKLESRCLPRLQALKRYTFWDTYVGLEGPLFHGCTSVSEFFRSLGSRGLI
jgi:hypothetical protein